jgi:hypothetical protein
MGILQPLLVTTPLLGTQRFLSLSDRFVWLGRTQIDMNLSTTAQAAGTLRGSGGKVINVPSPAGPVILQNPSLTSASAPINCAFNP